jgi:phosphoribosylformylglycinamidine synthase
MREIVTEGLAESAHDLSDGGLAVALAESCTAALGATIKVGQAGPDGTPPVLLLFGESPSRILLTTRNVKQVERIMFRRQIDGGVIGVTMKGRLQVEDDQTMLIDVATSDLKSTFENSLPEVLQNQHA